MTIAVSEKASPPSTDKPAPPGDAQPAAAAQASAVPVVDTAAPSTAPVVVFGSVVEGGGGAGGSAGAAHDQQPADSEHQVATPGGAGAKRRRAGENWFSGSPGSGQAGPGAQTQRRKESHNATEQKRRQRINDKMMELKDILPDSRESSVDKATILNQAIDYIKTLQTEAEAVTLRRP
ncbi:Myc-type, basic helix-loop-helix domain-containing protein [Baffinella frigidus]|nr:Myc-type, basic helix-loop-helix domain-containing protein [Cryptophyta sp. CCMP2293]